MVVKNYIPGRLRTMQQQMTSDPCNLCFLYPSLLCSMEQGESWDEFKLAFTSQRSLPLFPGALDLQNFSQSCCFSKFLLVNYVLIQCLPLCGYKGVCLLKHCGLVKITKFPTLHPRIFFKSLSITVLLHLEFKILDGF